MKQFTERYEVMLTKEQSNTLIKLRNRKIRVSDFIRDAIREKIEREKPKLLPRKLTLAKIKERYF